MKYKVVLFIEVGDDTIEPEANPEDTPTPEEYIENELSWARPSFDEMDIASIERVPEPPPQG